jgi:hypothetical protein
MNVPGGCLRRGHSQYLCQSKGQCVCAMVAAQQRHDGTAVLGDRHHWRLGPLVGEMRCRRPDQDAGGADADDRCSVREQPAEMGGGVETPVRASDTAFRPVDLPADRAGGAAGGIEAALGQDHEDGSVHGHASPRLWTRIIEK